VNPTWVGFSVSSFVPPTASEIRVMPTFHYNGVTAFSNVLCSPNNAMGNNRTLNPCPLEQALGSTSIAWWAISEQSILLESSSLYWVSSAAGGPARGQGQLPASTRRRQGRRSAARTAPPQPPP
jgi:hypothetical protein